MSPRRAGGTGLGTTEARQNDGVLSSKPANGNLSSLAWHRSPGCVLACRAAASPVANNHGAIHRPWWWPPREARFR